jgi:nucleoside 2-deoxyribosyltransferase
MKGAMKVKFQYLRKVPIVVADLTGLDPNVLYESGYRRALGKPVVYLIEKKRKLPFDLYDIPPVYVDLSAPEVKNCRANLVEKIKQAQKVVPKARKIKEKVAKAKTVSP